MWVKALNHQVAPDSIPPEHHRFCALGLVCASVFRETNDSSGFIPKMILQVLCEVTGYPQMTTTLSWQYSASRVWKILIAVGFLSTLKSR